MILQDDVHIGQTAPWSGGVEGRYMLSVLFLDGVIKETKGWIVTKLLASISRSTDWRISAIDSEPNRGYAKRE